MFPTTNTAYLRVYQPLGAFPPEERRHWTEYLEGGRNLPANVLIEREERQNLLRALGAPIPLNGDHALVERRDDTIYICPLRTELRVLQALADFRRLFPDDVIDAFVPLREVDRAVRLLHRMHRERPGIVPHVLQASWYVPLAWFTLFDDRERSVRPGTSDTPPRLVYGTAMTKARARLTRALKPLVDLADEPDIAGAVEELRDWLDEFDRDSLVFLDYGGLARTIPFGDLVEDHSARDIWEAIVAFEEGDAERSGEVYTALIERWGELRGRESRN